MEDMIMNTNDHRRFRTEAAEIVNESRAVIAEINAREVTNELIARAKANADRLVALVTATNGQ